MFRKGLEHLPEPYRSLISRLFEELLRLLNDRLKSLVVYGSVARGTAGGIVTWIYSSLLTGYRGVGWRG